MTVTEAAEALRALAGIGRDLDPEVVRAAEDALSEITAGWPVDTGRSLAGWSMSVDGGIVTIENDTAHAEFVHGGGAAAEAESSIETAGASLAENIERISAEALELE